MRRLSRSSANWGNLSLLRHVEEVVNQCDVCKALDKAPHTPIGGTSTVATFNEKLQVDLLFLGDLIVLRIMDVFSRYSIPTRVVPKIRWKFGMHLLHAGLAFSALPRLLRRTRGANGRMNFGPTFARIVAFTYFFKTQWTCADGRWPVFGEASVD